MADTVNIKSHYAGLLAFIHDRNPKLSENVHTIVTAWLCDHLHELEEGHFYSTLLTNDPRMQRMEKREGDDAEEYTVCIFKERASDKQAVNVMAQWVIDVTNTIVYAAAFQPNRN